MADTTSPARAALPSPADMLADYEAKLSAALAMNPTPGPWSVGETALDPGEPPETVIRGLGGAAGVGVALDFGRNNPGWREANAALMAAADPVCIGLVLHEFKRLRAENERLREDMRAGFRIGNELTLETQTVEEMAADLVRQVRDARAALGHHLAAAQPPAEPGVCMTCAGQGWEPSVYAGRRPCSRCAGASAAIDSTANADLSASRNDTGDQPVKADPLSGLAPKHLSGVGAFSLSQRWATYEGASADPLFHQCRGIMGTVTWGQDDALRRTLLHFATQRQGVPSGFRLVPLEPTPEMIAAACWLDRPQMRRDYTRLIEAAPTPVFTLGDSDPHDAAYQQQGQMPKQQPDPAWHRLARQLVQWRHCMSYNDSYFGEPAGLLKHIAAEFERLLPPNDLAAAQAGTTGAA